MARKLVAVLCLIVFSVSLSGCATTNPDGAPSPGGSTAAGAVGGAVLGGAIGALCGLIPFGGGIAGAVARGAIAGAATGVISGAIAGFAYGKYEEKLHRDRQTAEAFHQYKSEQGEKVFVEVVEVKPENAEQGGSVYLNSTFSVLTGNSEPVPVEISQVVMVQDKVCGQPYCHKGEKISGTYAIAIPMQIPANAPNGKYKLMTQVKTGNATDQKVCEFVVAKKAAPPATPTTPEQPGKPEEKAVPEAKTTG